MADDDNDVLYELRGDVAWITLNRPAARNALSLAVNARIIDIAQAFEYGPEVLAVVITGTGDGVFCAGADLKERRGVAARDSARFIQAIGNAIACIADIRRPTIALMNGSAYGGGLELALACDFRIIVEGSELALTEVKLGIMPGAGGTVRLPRLIGEARAKELILLGRRISAERALELGLVTQVVPKGQLLAAGDALLAELGLAAPLSVMHAKSAIERGYGKPVEEALEIERQCYDVTLNSADRDEGLAAFAEKRPPRFEGR